MLDKERKVNRKHKDSVFTKLFSKKSNLLELYNAVSGKNYPKSTEIKIITLSNVLFMEQLNDICFVIDGRLVVLIEHQSTVNENICLRMLDYVSREYEKITNRKDLYRRKMVKIPAPEFIVLYNGKEKFPDFKEMRLSDSFKFKSETCFLELVVKAYNINKGRNVEMAGRSPTLDGYETFIAEIKANLKKKMALPKAIRLAIKTCLNKKILVSFLEEHASEVENMILTEWNMDDAIAVAKEEEREEIAENMLAKGFSVADVLKATDLPREQIMALKRS